MLYGLYSICTSDASVGTVAKPSSAEFATVGVTPDNTILVNRRVCHANIPSKIATAAVAMKSVRIEY